MALDAAVIGGGISGLASALRIASLGHRVTLIESEDFLGGLGTTFPWRDGHLERFYHCILPDDEALLRVIHELGLGPQLQWKQTAMGFMFEKRIFPLNTPMDLLRFGPLTFYERLRMGLMGLRVRAAGLRPDLDDVTAQRWIESQVGRRAFEILWRPLLSAKIGDGYSALPALWLSSRMVREKNTGPEVKGCLTGGYRALIDTFESALRARGVTIRLRTRVRAIEMEGERMALPLDDGSRPEFDFVVATSPLTVFQKMAAGLPLPPGLARLTLDYQGVISGVFLMEKPLSRYYWMPWVQSGATAQGAIEMSNLVPLSRSQGLYVNYLVNYTHRDGPLFQKNDAELLGLYRADLERLFPEAAPTVVDQYLFRAPFVEPIWTVGYRRLRPPTTVLPGRLYLACTAQVYPRINSWNSCCHLVEEMMPSLAAETAARATVATGTDS